MSTSSESMEDVSSDSNDEEINLNGNSMFVVSSTNKSKRRLIDPADLPQSSLPNEFPESIEASDSNENTPKDDSETESNIDADSCQADLLRDSGNW